MLNQLIIATEIAFAAALIAPFIKTAIWVLSPIWSQPAPVAIVPDLGPELEGEQIIAAIERHIPAAAQAIAAPAATLNIKLPPLVDDGEPVQVFNYPAMKVAELRHHSKQAGIKWRNAHGPNRHMRKAEMVAALEAA